MGRKHRVDEVIRALEKKGCKIDNTNVIDCKKATNLGNKSWGKIDFLVNHCGFIVINYIRKRDE